jgi:glycine cleavage system aminomethyltransferase T
LRIEKFYAFWGQDLDSHVTPLECGRAFRTKLDKDIDFIGRKALEEQQKVKC